MTRSETRLNSFLAFENKRQTIGLFLGPMLFGSILALGTPDEFVAQAQRMLSAAATTQNVAAVATSMTVVLALLVLMVTWWITEAIPLPVTALLPGVVLPLFHVTGVAGSALFSFDAKNVLMNYAHPVIFLFLGGFLIATAMQKWGLDKRLTLFILTRGSIANDTRLVMLGMMAITAFISMWISNTATTAMMLPAAVGVLRHAGGEPGKSHYGTGLMLGIAWAASIGGVGTIIGTAPNGICVSILQSSGLADISFVDWMKFGVPYVVVMVPIAWLILLKMFPPEVRSIIGGKAAISEQRIALGRWSNGEKVTIVVFHLAVVLWITNPFWPSLLPSDLVHRLAWFDEYVVALFCALLLFMIPVDWKKKTFALDWSDSAAVDWGALLLFGGGIALSDAMFKTGVSPLIAHTFVALAGTPSTFVLLLLFVFLIDFMTEVTSNTAVTSMMIPVVISIAHGAGANPLVLAIGSTVAASMAFMLPVATPPNAIVYGTGYIKITQMAKAGFVLDIVGWILTVAIIYGLAHVALGLF